MIKHIGNEFEFQKALVKRHNINLNAESLYYVIEEELSELKCYKVGDKVIGRWSPDEIEGFEYEDCEETDEDILYMMKPITKIIDHTK